MWTSLLPKAGAILLPLCKQTQTDVSASDLMNSQLYYSTSHAAASWTVIMRKNP